MRRGLVILIAALFLQSAWGHFGPQPAAPREPIPWTAAPSELEARRLDESVARRFTARLIADGLMHEFGWQAIECSEPVSVTLRQGSESHSFCYVYDSGRPATLVALEGIFRQHEYEWEELGWTSLVEGLGGVYRSTVTDGRYVIVIVDGAKHDDGIDSTHVIVSVAHD